MESLAPIVLVVLPSFVQIVEQSGVKGVPQLLVPGFDFEGVNQGVLRVSGVSRVDVDHLVSCLSQNSFWEVLIVPPEAAAHTDCLLVQDWPRMNGITTNESSQTASPDAHFGPLCSVVESLVYKRQQLFLDKIQIRISLATHFFRGVVRICVLVVSVVSIPDSNNNYLLHFPLDYKTVEGILNLPGPKSRFRVLKQILTIVHQQKGIRLEGIVVPGGRVVDATFARVVQVMRTDRGRVHYSINGGVETRVHSRGFN